MVRWDCVRWYQLVRCSVYLPFYLAPATAGEQSVLNLHFQFANTLAAANREGRAAAAEIVEFLITKGTDGHPGLHSDLGQV